LPAVFSTSAPISSDFGADLLRKMRDLLEVEICADRMSETSLRLAMVVH
jgi:hypothetical protein